MKKALLTLIAACAAATCLAGCASCNSSSSASQYEEINAMLAMDYSRVKLTVSETFDDVVLKSEYTLDYTANGVTVTYSVQRFAEVSLEGAGSSKETLTGTAVIVNGAVVSVNGEDANITADIAETGLSFKEEYFENADCTSKYLRADVKDADAFMGSDVTCTNMRVFTNYDKFLYDIQITYTSASGNSVEYMYVFKT